MHITRLVATYTITGWATRPDGTWPRGPFYKKRIQHPGRSGQVTAETQAVGGGDDDAVW